VNFILDTRISRIDQSLRTVGDHLFRPDHFFDGELCFWNCFGLTFSRIISKKSQIISHGFEIPYIIALITKIRYKMAPKDILISALWGTDRSKIGL